MKKIPLRKCLATGKQFPKTDLIRIVKLPSGEIRVDITGRLNGRGAYLSKSETALDTAIKKGLISKAFDEDIDESIFLELRRIIKDE